MGILDYRNPKDEKPSPKGNLSIAVELTVYVFVIGGFILLFTFLVRILESCMN